MLKQWLVACLFSSSVFAATLSVEADGSGNFLTLQDALLVASDGDAVEVGPGTYTGQVLTQGLGVHIRSTDGAESTFLQADASDAVLVFGFGDDADTVVEGFTVVNPGGLGLRIEDAGPTLIDLHFEGLGHSESKGGAVEIRNGSPSFERCRFISNEAKLGGAIYAKSAQLTLKSCAFEENQAKNGGALWGTDLIWIDEGSSYDFNLADKQGGAVFLEAPFDGLISDGQFWSNESFDSGGAVWAEGEPGALEFLNVRFIANETYNSGAGVMAQSFAGPLRFEGCHFDGNNGTYDHGSAIYSAYYTDLTLVDTVVENHIAAYRGAGVYHYYKGDFLCQDSLFEDNHSRYSGGGLHIQDLYSDGIAQIENCQFVGNSAGYEGGGLYVEDVDSIQLVNSLFQGNESGPDSPGGGAALFRMEQTQLENNAFVDNRGGFGGALHLEEAGATQGPHTLYNNLFVENVANYGGALLLTGTPRPRGELAYGGEWSDQPESENDFVLYEDSTAPEGDWSAAASWDFGEIQDDDGYVVFYTPILELPEVMPTQMRMQVYSPHTEWSLVGRLVDASGETFYGEYGAVDWTGWHDVAIDGVQEWSNWGGNDDGLFDLPISQITLQIVADKGTSGTVRFDDVRVDTLDSGEVFLIGWEQPKWPISLVNNSFIANHGLSDGGAVLAWDTAAAFRNNLVVSTGSGLALSLLDSLSQGDWDITYNAFNGNVGGDLPEGVSGISGVEGDPGFAFYTQNGALEDDRLVFLQGSPYRDAGDPSLLDPDGSPSDLGANAGPLALWVDEDGDGHTSGVDCNDTDPDIHPGAEPVPYDGINQNCTLGSDFDADSDGLDALAYGGEDCDDTDPTLQLECGDPDTGGDPAGDKEEGASCGCTAAPDGPVSPWGLAWIGSVLAVLGVRRQGFSER
jgi:predicted outer membrane repeat protein